MSYKVPNTSFKETLEEILSEKEIRFAGFVNIQGNLIEGKFRADVIPFESDEEQQKIFRELAYRISTRKKFDYSGAVKYSASRREKLVMMSFPLKEMILLITAEPNVNIDRLAYKIIQILGKDWSEFHGD
jgi:hypothetical protein